jgi:streptogramin lyase
MINKVTSTENIITNLVKKGTIINYNDCAANAIVLDLATKNTLPGDNSLLNATRYKFCSPYYNNVVGTNDDRKPEYKIPRGISMTKKILGCAANTYVDGLSCINCAAGKSSVIGGVCTDCPAGQSSVAGGPCTPCPAGYYCPGGTAEIPCITPSITPRQTYVYSLEMGEVLLNGPSGVAVDSVGNIYITNRSGNTITKRPSSGAAYTLAGSGTEGFADGTGVAARFNGPWGIAVNSAGVVYVADMYADRIRRITPEGVVSTLAGSGIAGFANGTGTAARFNGPVGIALDSAGNVYVGDSQNHRIRKITPAGVVTTFAGSGTRGFANGTGSAAQFSAPYGVAVDSAGFVYVADSGNHMIRKITPQGVVSTLAGTGTQGYLDGISAHLNGIAPDVQFSFPLCVAVDSAGNVFSETNLRIRKITPEGVVVTIAGSGTNGYLDGASGYLDGNGATARFALPNSIAVSEGIVYVADRDNNQIRKLAQTCNPVTGL